METINKVRTRHFVQGKNISEIARELNLSRNTVKKYLKDDYPLSYQREKQPKPLLGSFHSQLLDRAMKPLTSRGLSNALKWHIFDWLILVPILL